MKNVILVGGFGFVGRNIINALQNSLEFSDLSPCVIDDLSNAAPDHASVDVAFHDGEYQSDRALEFAEMLTGQRIFVFLAGETRVADSKERPLDFIKANIGDPSAFVMAAVRPGDHFILVSTAGALFDGTFEVRTASAYCPKNFYGATKAAEEMVLQKLVELRGATFGVVRLTNVYGVFSDRKKSAIHAFTRAAIAGDEVVINGDGEQTRDFVFSGDVGHAIAVLLRRVAQGETVDPVHMIGSGASTSLMEVVQQIGEQRGRSLRYRKTPVPDLIASEPRDVIANKNDVRVLLGDGITQFAQGISKTYAYYERRH